MIAWYSVGLLPVLVLLGVVTEPPMTTEDGHILGFRPQMRCFQGRTMLANGGDQKASALVANKRVSQLLPNVWKDLQRQSISFSSSQDPAIVEGQ